MTSIFNTIVSGYNTLKNIAGKVESVLHLLGILSDDMVLVDLLQPAMDILIDDFKDEIVDGISQYYFT